MQCFNTKLIDDKPMQSNTRHMKRNLTTKFFVAKIFEEKHRHKKNDIHTIDINITQMIMMVGKQWVKS